MNAPEKVTSTFAMLAALNVSEHVEKKGQFSYLSWPWAVKQLRLADPTATWEVLRFNSLPYLKTDLGYFVEVAVTVQGITLSQIHPVLDGRNKPIQAPTPFDINTSIQRCLVKAIALHGLGLYIYAGEDLPEPEKSEEQEKPVQLKSAKPVTKAEFDSLSEEEQQFLRDLAMGVVSNTDEKAMFQAYQEAKKGLDSDEQTAFWSLFDSKQRSAIKRVGETLKGMAA